MNWKCPVCNNVRRAPSASPLEDSHRFCFPCNEVEGHLVRRVSVARESKAAKARAARVTKLTLRRLSPKRAS